jgi:Family of unknown function (DUF5995)
VTSSLSRLPEAKTVDNVLTNINQIIAWAIQTESQIGYFAVVYQRVTLAIRDAINDGRRFTDEDRVTQLDVAFAQRYFNALNAYFYPEEFAGPTMPWEVVFVAAQDSQAIILQHMMIAFNAHITFDLGMACYAVAPEPDPLNALKGDFDSVNDLLCDQVEPMVEILQQLSPELVWTRRLIPDELGVLKRFLRKLRRGAWEFAVYMALNPKLASQKRVSQAAWAATLGTWYMQPPTRWTPFPLLIREIGKHESRNVADNIRALQGMKSPPHG